MSSSLGNTTNPSPCSWCFANARHQSEGAPGLLASQGSEIFHCMSCMQKTIRCKNNLDLSKNSNSSINCRAMARAYDDKSVSDKECYVCMGVIPEWGGNTNTNANTNDYNSYQPQQQQPQSGVRSARVTDLDMHLPCSNCFQPNAAHKLRIYRKRVYECRTCQVQTHLCDTTLKEREKNGGHTSSSSHSQCGMAKQGNKKCAMCMGLVTNWQAVQANISAQQAVGYCSVCLTNGPHQRVEKNTIERDLYRCETCKSDAKLCSECKVNFCKAGSYKSRACLQCVMENPDEKRGGLIGSTMNKVTGGRTNKGPVRALLGGIKGLLGRDDDHRSSSRREERGRRRKGSQERDRSRSMSPGQADTMRMRSLTWNDLVARKEALYKVEMTPQMINNELSRNSAQRQEATQLGLLRPFLYLVSMHPAGRYSLSLALELDLINTPAYGDAHREAMVLLCTPKKGISPNADGVSKKMSNNTNDGRGGSDWYEILLGINDTCTKMDGFELHGGSTRDASFDKGNRWENILLESVSILNRTKIHPKYDKLVERLMESKPFQELFSRMPPAFRESRVLRRAVVESTLCAELAERNISPFEDRAHEFGEAPPSYNEKNQGAGPTGTASSADLEVQDLFDDLDVDGNANNANNIQFFSDVMVRNLHNRLALGNGYYEKKKKAVTVGVSATVMVVNTFVITPLCFPAGLAIKIANMKYKKIHNEYASHHRANFAAVVLLLMHQILLVTQGIDISRYY
eukprot:Nk52_evm13s2103 gene=Nk52_evmTU13s2103